jgi:asparagine synthase (glutamine-hydrolysing)
MSDFVIDFRKSQFRSATSAVNLLKYYDDIKISIIDRKRFTLILSRADDLAVWGPYETLDKKVLVGLGGRIALDGKKWEDVKDYPGKGGLACKAICQMYLEDGINRLGSLNGSFVVLVYDASIEKLYIITDRCGMFPCFRTETDPSQFVFSSHPDILAATCGLKNDIDLTSMAEFLISGKVSFPFTYYKKIMALDYGTIHTIDVREDSAIYESARKYFTFNYSIDTHVSEWELAEELGEAFKRAINRRTLSLFGQTAISLSGGLDSRAILCSAENRDEIKAFCFFDEENLEFRLARDIAREAGVNFIPFRRSFDYYGDNAEMGVRISAGMGDFGSNHYLGFRDALSNAGITNLIAGFYCDYLFKALALNKKKNKFLQKERFTSFQYQNYMPLFWFKTRFAEEVRARFEEKFPDDVKNDSSDIGLLRIEQKRLFPLCYEPDNQETIVAQRVLGWYLPTVDNDIIDVYLKIPPQYKLNVSLYSKMVQIQCGDRISAITNINTGTRVNAPQISIALHGLRMALKRRLKSRRKTIATDESWPDWDYYVPHSNKIKTLWAQKDEVVENLFHEIMGKDSYEERMNGYEGPRLKLFLRVLTLKLWFEQKV